MTAYVILIAPLIALFVLTRRGLETTFLWVWIPFYLLMPFAFWVHPGIPNTNFMQATTIPLMFALAYQYASRVRIGPMETLLALYMLLRIYADYTSRGYWDAQNFTYLMLTNVASPYLIGRHLIADRRMDVATSRAFVVVFLLLFPLFLYELKFWVTPVFKLLSPLFPNAGSGLSLRWGVARTAGPFEHPILACIMIIAVYRLHRWLAWIGEWDKPQSGALGFLQRWSRRIPLPFHWQISIVLILMALMTISRGPWIGGFVGAAIVMAGNARNRASALWKVAAVLVIAGIAGKMALDAYITPDVGEVLTGEARTMLYRKNLVDRYMEFLLERVWWGWGFTTVPEVPGMESVDNAFFLMALQHGVIVLAVFVVTFGYAIASQIRHGLKAPPGAPPIGFTFAGIYVMCFISFATVYMGSQTEPLLFLLLGWGENARNRADEASSSSAAPQAATPPSLPFRHVMR